MNEEIMTQTTEKHNLSRKTSDSRSINNCCHRSLRHEGQFCRPWSQCWAINDWFICIILDIELLNCGSILNISTAKSKLLVFFNNFFPYPLQPIPRQKINLFSTKCTCTFNIQLVANHNVHRPRIRECTWLSVHKDTKLTSSS